VVLGEGYHKKFGAPHAETEALMSAAGAHGIAAQDFPEVAEVHEDLTPAALNPSFDVHAKGFFAKDG